MWGASAVLTIRCRSSSRFPSISNCWTNASNLKYSLRHELLVAALV
jgi:hypothetical protein